MFCVNLVAVRMLTPQSAIVCTLNKARRTCAMLESVKWADEIITMDPSSTGDKIEVAHKFGA